MPVAASLETPIEFIGFIGNNNGSETTPRTGPLLDVTYIETLAKAHENAGFDRALVDSMRYFGTALLLPAAVGGGAGL